jgi:replication factor C large subunit
MSWTEKHRPKSFEQIKGQDEAVARIKNFIKNFDSAKKNAVLLYGPSGVGKTTIAYVAAKETNSEIFELNASDFRNKEKLQEILKPAIEQKSLTKKGKIILVDEVDGILDVDKGGVAELIGLIDISSYPVILTANDVWSKKLNPLRKKTELVQLKEIDYKTIKEVIFDILRKENLFLDNEILTKLAIKAKGDLRAAINDLQALSKVEDYFEIEFDERNKEIDIFNSLKQIFKGKPTNELLTIFDSVNMNLDEIILWVEENIPAEYRGEELQKAYDRLSKVDVFKGRIYKQQYWRFLIYENILLSYGISASKSSEKRPGFTSYKKPTRILKIWLNNQKTARKKSIAQKYARRVHVGEKRAMKEFPIIKQIIKSNPQIQKELKLDKEEIEYLQTNS